MNLLLRSEVPQDVERLFRMLDWAEERSADSSRRGDRNLMQDYAQGERGGRGHRDDPD